MSVPSPKPATEPPKDCPRCPRLVEFREELRAEYPDWWNAPVPAFGDPEAWLGIIGLAPGKHGANRTGRPFTGDYAGDLLYRTLDKFDFSDGTYAAKPDDGLRLKGAVIVNAVKCLPPANKPTPEEIRTCREFLTPQLVALDKALGGKLPKAKFGHLAEHRMPDGRIVIDSYHCSRYNTNTGRLTAAMFEAVFARARDVRAT